MKVTHLNHYDLTEDERNKLDVGEEDYEGWSWLKVEFKGQEPQYFLDAMEPEDGRFYRGMAWIQPLIEAAYEAGKAEQAEPPEDAAGN